MECQEIVDYFVKIGKTKIAILYQNDAYGMAGLRGTIAALKKHNLKLVARTTYERNTVEVDEAISVLKDANPEAIIMIGAYAPCAEFIKKAKKAGIKALFHNVSFVGPEKLLESLGADGEGVIVTQVVPLIDADSSDYVIVDWFKSDMKKYFPNEKYTLGALEGYLNGLILVEGLKRCGENITRENLIAQIETIKPGQLGTGMKIDFSSDNHQGCKKVFLTEIRSGKFVYIK